MGRLLAILSFVVALLTAAPALAIVDVTEPADIGIGTARFALVIGNSAYQSVSPLPNTVNDARAMSASLTSVGFKVFRAEDVDRRGMQGAIEQFLAAVTAGSEALVYYAGHGVELEGQNYLLPTDIPDLGPNQRYSLRTDAFSLSLLIEDLQSRGARVNIVLLDACRNNPFTADGTRALGGTRGLSRLDPPQGTVVIYAAGAGETALDNLGPDDASQNGLFTRNLLDLITTPGLEIRQMVQELKERVYAAALGGANHTQRPSYYDGLIGRFYFVPGASTVATPTRNRCETLVEPGLTADRLLFADPAVGLAACREALALAPGQQNYLDLLATAEEQLAAQKALMATDQRLADAYLRLYPEGGYADDVRIYVASLGGAAIEVTPEPVEAELAAPPDLFPRDIAVLDELKMLGTAELTKGVQLHLNRLGCAAGSEDGVWGGKGRLALANLELSTGQSTGTTVPTPTLLAQLLGIESKVCLPCFEFNGRRYCE